MAKKKYRPIGVSVIATFILLISLLQIFGGLGLVLVGGTSCGVGSTGFCQLFFVIGLFLAVIGIFHFVISIGLFRGKSWARVLAIITHSLSVVLSVVALFSSLGGFVTAILSGAIIMSLISAAWNVFVAVYLAFDDDAEKYFR